ncbi:hypothetical protein P154DRAFT_528290 [Amniculicola lignicola CBS 123094]|uniref:F-box domain-containing protein n=1 Tax=Amniculicola lignicola CBS 123094 TaxID=1392246 RepID=A0A6A5VS94_9PLEO|nr:hypothetical protein P154DRAFT_528290 [Amniculicola lignicola CBS 123094]
MDSNIFCVLCGGPFHLEHHIYSLNPQKAVYQWMYDVRLLATPSALSRQIIGVYSQEQPTNLSEDDNVFLSQSTQWKITDSDCFRLGESYYCVLTDDGHGNVIFPLHHACIQIGCRVLELHPGISRVTDQLSPLGRLNQMLRLQFQYNKSSGVGVGHDLFNLNSENQTGDPRSLLAMDELGWWGDEHEKFLTDPLEIPGISQFILDVLRATPRTSGPESPAVRPLRSAESIEKMPNELLDIITAHLPPLSVVALHRSSRLLSLKVPLDAHFYREYVANGSLFPQVWDLDNEELEDDENEKADFSRLDGLWDWKSVVRLLQKKEFSVYGLGCGLSEAIPLGFWNRCRIWRIIEDACPP